MLEHEADPGTPAQGSRHARRRLAPRFRVLLAAILLIAAGGIAVRLITEPSRSCQQALIPAYFYPGPDWVSAIDSKPPPRIMIFDITSSGAGSSPDRSYQAAVRRAQAAGITLAGYANTNYTRRSAAAVEADVLHYKAWYGVTDIFLDEVSSDTGGLAYYRHLSDYVHGLNPGSLVILNPGTYPAEQYMSVGDIVMVFEDTYANYVKVDVPKWAENYPPDKFAYVIYGASSAQLADAISMSQRRHVGYIYVTPNTGINPYISLPSYWASENAIIAACAGLLTGRDCAGRREPG